MSALTKLFVSLLIVCSLLLTAATVTFVNQTADFKQALDRSEAQIAKANHAKELAERAQSAAEAREAKAIADANAAATSVQAQLAALKDDVSKRDVTVNELQAKIAVQNAAITDLAAAQKTSQSNLGDLQKRYDTVLADHDKLRVANAELTGANFDYQKQLDVIERERRILVEQNNQLKSDLTTARRVLADNNITLENAVARNTPAPRLVGSIQQVKADHGVTYATISLGAADKVQKGMQLNVINKQTMEFLGKIIVETVEANEAWGRLEGPRIQEIDPKSAQVLSQL